MSLGNLLLPQYAEQVLNPWDEPFAPTVQAIAETLAREVEWFLAGVERRNR